jgi:hypothetical protein
VADRGAPLAEHFQGGTRLLVFDEGFTVEKNGQASFEPYDRVQRVFYQETSVTVNGIPLPTRASLTVHLAGSAVQTFSAVGQGNAAAIRTFVAASSPAILRRCRAELASGADLDFGAFRLSQGRIAWRARGRERVLPMARLSGFLLRSGWLLLDEDPEQPHVVVERRAGEVANAFALVELLRELKPDADLEQGAVAQRSIARASSLPWKQTTAVKRWIGYPSRPARFFLLMAFIAPPLLWALICCIPAKILRGRTSDAHQQLSSTVALGNRAIKEMSAAPAPTVSTRTACAGKLDLDDLRAAGAYIGEFPQEADSALNYDVENVGKSFVGLAPKGDELWGKKESFESDFLVAWETFVGEPPWSWGRRLRPPFPNLNVKTVAVARVVELDLIKKKETYGKRPERARLQVRLIDRSGATLCEGIDTLWLDEWDRGAIPLERAPIALLCPGAESGALCRMAFSPSAPFSLTPPTLATPPTPPPSPMGDYPARRKKVPHGHHR